MSTTRTFEIDGPMQVVLAVMLTETVKLLERQKATRRPVRIYGAAHATPFVSEEVTDDNIHRCRELIAQIWDGGAADLLIDGKL